MSLVDFIEALKATTPSNLADFCRENYLHGTPYVFKNRETDFFQFKNTIAKQFKIRPDQVYLVGSAKLGFSPHKNKLFGLDSDIDVAIIAENLYHDFELALQEFEYDRRNFRVNLTKHQLYRYNQFLYYLAIGWMRPDLLPHERGLKRKQEKWFDFFDSISYGKSTVGNYKVSAAAYKSISHLERYIQDSVVKIKEAK